MKLVVIIYKFKAFNAFSWILYWLIIFVNIKSLQTLKNRILENEPIWESSQEILEKFENLNTKRET